MQPEEIRSKLLAFYQQEVLMSDNVDERCVPVDDATSILRILTPFLDKKTVNAIELLRDASGESSVDNHTGH